jgi:hypothetical protein
LLLLIKSVEKLYLYSRTKLRKRISIHILEAARVRRIMGLSALHVLFSFLLLSACWGDPGQQQGFEPLAGVRISLSQAQVPRLLQTIQSFAQTEGLRVETANYPKQTRIVMNLNLIMSAETFFHIGNFRDPNQFDLNAYSHEYDGVWRPVWTRLTNSIVETFGTANVSERHFPK